MANHRRRQPQDNGLRRVPSSSRDILRLARQESERASQGPVVRRQPILDSRSVPSHSKRNDNKSLSNKQERTLENTSPTNNNAHNHNTGIKKQNAGIKKKNTNTTTVKYSSSSPVNDAESASISQSLKDTVRKAASDSQKSSSRSGKENGNNNAILVENSSKSKKSKNNDDHSKYKEENVEKSNKEYDVNNTPEKKSIFSRIFRKNNNKNSSRDKNNVEREKKGELLETENNDLNKETVENTPQETPSKTALESDKSENGFLNNEKQETTPYDEKEEVAPDFHADIVENDIHYNYIPQETKSESDISQKAKDVRRPVSISPSSDKEDNADETFNDEDALIVNQDSSNPQLIETSEALSPEEIASLKSGTVKIVAKDIAKTKKKMGFFSFVMANWFFAILSASVALAGFGYYIYLDSAQEKETTAAYNQGVRDATSEDTIESVMKKDTQQVKDMIIEAARGSFPEDVKTADIIMDGWTVPRGNQNYGRVDISICFTGKDIEGSKVAKANFISNNANSTDPQWMVDAVAITQENCWSQNKAKEE